MLHWSAAALHKTRRSYWEGWTDPSNIVDVQEVTWSLNALHRFSPKKMFFICPCRSHNEIDLKGRGTRSNVDLKSYVGSALQGNYNTLFWIIMKKGILLFSFIGTLKYNDYFLNWYITFRLITSDTVKLRTHRHVTRV